MRIFTVFKLHLWLCTEWVPDLYKCKTHEPGEKLEQRTRWGLLSSSNHNITLQRKPPPSSVPWSHSPRISQVTSLPKFIPTNARVTQDSPPLSLHSLPATLCPSSYSCNNCSLPGTQVWHALWVPGAPDSVLLKHLNRKISHFFLFHSSAYS